MLNYKNFIQKINENTSFTINDLCRTIKEYGKCPCFSELACNRLFGQMRDYPNLEIKHDYDKFKKHLLDSGFTKEKIKQIYLQYKDIILAYNSGFTFDIDSIEEKYKYIYSGFVDLLFYEIDNSYTLSGFDLKEMDDTFTKYAYGWHTSKYGKLSIIQQFQTVENFEQYVLNVDILKKDDTFLNLLWCEDDLVHEKINDYYIVFKNCKVYENESYDNIYMYYIGNDVHVLINMPQYKKLNNNNFKDVINCAVENLEDTGTFFKNNEFPIDIKLDDPKLQNILKSGKGIRKFDF